MAGPVRVVVVGAGHAGLAAATHLVARGALVTVLEARRRVGGRTETIVDDDGRPLDVGGQALNADMRRVLALVERHGLTTLPLPQAPPSAVVPGTDPADLPRVAAAAEALLARLGDARPGPQATAADLVEDTAPDPATAALARSALEELLGADPARVSGAHLAAEARAYRSERSDWELHLAEGLGGLAARVAAALGERVLLRHPVERVSWSADGALVEAAGLAFAADRVVVAVPPTVVGRIAFFPALPPDLAAALDGWADGAVIKARIRYPEAFWRHGGTGLSLRFADPPGVQVADTTDPEGRHPGLTVFLNGRIARKLAPLQPADRLGRIQDLLRPVLGEGIRWPVGYRDRVWVDDPWSGGGYNAHRVAGAPPEVAEVLRRGTGPIAFAASEIAPVFPGFVEGAIAAGQEAADRCLRWGTCALQPGRRASDRLGDELGPR
jgi:monoamine oxidase